jgi:hypothetical protein
MVARSSQVNMDFLRKGKVDLKNNFWLAYELPWEKGLI